MRLGIDLVSIRRFKNIHKADYRAWDRVFSEAEWEYGFKDVHTASHLAGIFAAKEAAMKATGKTGKEYFRYFKVTHKESAPCVNIKKSALSISHDGQYAIACVMVG